jgi:TonB family protein
MHKWLPVDPSRRRFAVGLLASLLLHVLLMAGLFLGRALSPPNVVTKRGEPLLVDIAPERREEPAPKGRPDRPATPDRREVERRQSQPPAPKETPPARRPSPPRPESPAARESAAVARTPPAKAAQPEPTPPSPAQSTPTPEAPAAPAQTARAEPRSEQTPPQQPPSDASGASTPSRATPAQPEVPDPKYALSKPSIDIPPSIFRRPGGGGGLRGGGRGGVEGEPIPLDTQDPKYLDYFNQIRERIKSKWIYPREAGDRGIGGQLMIEFHISRDGRLAMVELRRSSGVEILDDYALRAVQLAQPFPPVPAALAKAVLPVSGLFTYQIVNDAFVNQYLR